MVAIPSSSSLLRARVTPVEELNSATVGCLEVHVMYILADTCSSGDGNLSPASMVGRTMLVSGQQGVWPAF